MRRPPIHGPLPADTVEVELMPPSDNAVAVLTTEHGTLRAPDFQVSITVIGAAAASHDQEAIDA